MSELDVKVTNVLLGVIIAIIAFSPYIAAAGVVFMILYAYQAFREQSSPAAKEEVAA